MTVRSERKKISRHERRIATELGGRKTFASGSGDEKGDGRVAQKFRIEDGAAVGTVRFPLRIESKVTSRERYSLSALDWEKVNTAAAKAGEHPLFHITLTVKGLGTMDLCLIHAGLADAIGLLRGKPRPRPWARAVPAKSYLVAWKYWLGGPAMVLMENRPRPDRPHTLILADYLDVLKCLKESQ